MAVAAFMFSMNVNAQEPKQKAKKETAKTEKPHILQPQTGLDNSGSPSTPSIISIFRFSHPLTLLMLLYQKIANLKG